MPPNAGDKAKRPHALQGIVPRSRDPGSIGRVRHRDATTSDELNEVYSYAFVVSTDPDSSGSPSNTGHAHYTPTTKQPCRGPLGCCANTRALYSMLRSQYRTGDSRESAGHPSHINHRRGET